MSGRDSDDLDKKQVFILDPDAESFVITFYTAPGHIEPDIVS